MCGMTFVFVRLASVTKKNKVRPRPVSQEKVKKFRNLKLFASFIWSTVK